MFIGSAGWQHDVIEHVFKDTNFNMHKAKFHLNKYMEETAKIEQVMTEHETEATIYSHAMEQMKDFNQFFEDCVSCLFSITDNEKELFFKLFHNTVNKMREGNSISFDKDLKEQLLSLHNTKIV